MPFSIASFTSDGYRASFGGPMMLACTTFLLRVDCYSALANACASFLEGCAMGTSCKLG
jgi:hypothetical protein